VDIAQLDVKRLCGQLLVGGFDGVKLTARSARALRQGHRAGVILFKRNVGDVEQLLQLNRAIIEAAGDMPPFVSVDQEGGRVARLRAPFTELPPMRALGEADDLTLTTAVGEQIGHELRAVGFNLNFTPVMDVDSNPDNPVIGDRAFGSEPRAVMKHGVALLRGLQEAGVLACAKHFPGHGDTELDSHLELPTVNQPRERLAAVEIPPFRAASGAGVAAMMSAHVVYPALEPGVPATFSRAICTSLLRKDIGFTGALFSDDLEMGAITKSHDIEDAAVEAVWAGCDVLLICHDEALQERAHAALVRKCDTEQAFIVRCREAATRSLRLRELCPPAVAGDDVIARVIAGPEGAELADRIHRAGLKGDA